MLRILSDSEWRSIGITQSLGWEHYEVHGTSPRVSFQRPNLISSSFVGKRTTKKRYAAGLTQYGPHGKPSDAAKIKNTAAGHGANDHGAH